MERRSVGVKAEFIEVGAIVAVMLLACLAMPLLLHGSTGWVAVNNQFIVGPIVNCALVLTALRVRGVKCVGVMCLPSVLAVTVGLIGFMGVYAMYMIPMIWLGNAALVLGFKYLHVHKKINYAIVAVIGILAKAAIIFGGFQILVASGAIPTGAASAMFLGMGAYQILTASLGCLMAFGILKVLCRNRRV